METKREGAEEKQRRSKGGKKEKRKKEKVRVEMVEAG